MLLACLGGYLYGSLPFVDRLARARHVDLASTGSGNVGGANLWAATGMAYGALGWALDASKGLLPIALCRRLGYHEEMAAIAGVCGVAGQCWPLFLRRNGGRGISAFVGAGFMMDRQGWIISLLPLIGGGLWRMAPLIGRRILALTASFPWTALVGRSHGDDLQPTAVGVVPAMRPQSQAAPGAQTLSTLRGSRSQAVPLGCFIGIMIFPLACYARGPAARHAVRPSVALAALLLLRRLTAPLLDDAERGPRARRQALLFRLLYDRNTSR